MSAARHDFSEAVHLAPDADARLAELGTRLPNGTGCSLRYGRLATRNARAAGSFRKPTNRSLLFTTKRATIPILSLAESQKLSAPEHSDLLSGSWICARSSDTVKRPRLPPAAIFRLQIGHNGPSPLDAQQAGPVVIALAKHMEDAPIPALQRIALAYEGLNRPADARKVLERIVSLDPQNPAHLLELARLAEMSQDHESALGYLAHARELHLRIHKFTSFGA